MTLPSTAKTNSLGHLEIGGCDMVMLAKKYGTPLFVLDEKMLQEKANEYKSALKKDYPNSQVVFAGKALAVSKIFKLFASNGLGIDVSSGGELYTAIKSGIDAKKLYFHGNNKSRKEIEMALDNGIGRIVVDGIDELILLDEITKGTGIKTNILFRVNPGVEAHTHEYIKTGQVDSKFGVPKDKVVEAAAMAEKMRNIDFVGLHAHIGSQILDVKGFLEEVSSLLNYSKQIKDETGIEVKEVNIGGGIGISYTNEKAPNIKIFIEEIAKKVKAETEKLKITAPKLIIEPGRSLVGDSGVTLYSVGNIKDISGIRKYVSVDGGMGDNIRPSLYQAEYSAVVANKMKETKTEKITIAGRYCESGDILIKDIKLPKVERGDIVAMLCTGAYGYSMASNYNRVPRPAMVLVGGGKAKLILKRESYEDMIRNDIL